MKWILFGLIMGSTVTSVHDTEEACLGRAEVLKKRGGAQVECKSLDAGTTISGGVIRFSE